MILLFGIGVVGFTLLSIWLQLKVKRRQEISTLGDGFEPDDGAFRVIKGGK